MNEQVTTEKTCIVFQVKDLMTLLSISEKTAYELVRSGAIHSVRIGNSYRIPHEALTEFLAKTC